MSFPSLPGSVDRYVREILNRMLGRTGKAGDKVIFESDLVRLGLADEIGNALSQPVKPNRPITDSLKPVEGLQIPDKPVTPTGLSAAGTFGAVILQWQPPVYKGHNHTEVWRAQVDDREQATQVHEASGSRYSDVLGSSTPHYYWIRHVNTAGQQSGFNQLAGIQGNPTAIISVQDLLLEHPDITTQPFSVVNLGTEANPNYAIALNANIAVNGQVNISQLQSGELANGTALTVGQGSIEFGTGSDGYGQIVITGQGGIASKDYMLLKQGRIESYIYTASFGHVRYKEVRRNESGTAGSGQQVTVPAYFKAQPTIHLYPRDVSIYNAAYSTQSQRLEIWHTTPAPHPSIEGAWVFTPYARLVLSAGSDTVSANWTYSGNSNDQSAYLTNITNLQAITVYGRAASRRHTGSGNSYQNRKVTMYLYYRVSGTSNWISAGTTAVNVNQFNTHTLSLSKSLSTGQYDIRVRFIAADRSGTFTSGDVSYEYTERSASGSGWTVSKNGPNSGLNENHNITVSTPSMSGWEVTRIDYSFVADITLRARTLYASSYETNVDNNSKGYAEVTIPNGNSTKTFRFDSPDSNAVSGYPWREVSYSNQSFTQTDTQYKDGTIRPAVNIKAKYTGYEYNSGTPVASSYVSVTIKSVSATVYYRRVQSSSTTAYNQYYFDSASYNRGATDISLSNAVITWTASGE